MHMGRTTGPDTSRPWLQKSDGISDGAISADGRVMAGYMHGIFASDEFRRAFLDRLKSGRSGDVDYERRIDAALDGLAQHMEKHIDLDALLKLAR